MTAKTNATPATSAKTNAKPAVNMTNWNKAVRAARTAATRAGVANWTIGDSALSVATEYGENKIGRFSDEIGQEVTSVRNMRTVSAAYPPAGVARDLQTWTVYAVFASQDDRADLVTNGNDGQRWTVSAARALVASRKPAADDAPDGEGNESDGNESDDVEATRAKLAAEVTRLEGELLKARAALAKFETANPPAADATSAAAKHVGVRGVPEHTADQPNPACPTCKTDAARNGATVSQLTPRAGSPRRARARVSA